MKISIRTFFVTPLIVISTLNGLAQLKSNSINPDIQFNGEYLIYKGEKILLGPKAFYIDGQLTKEETNKYPYVFNSINEATKYLSDGTEDNPMVLFIAPWVYWIDDPDDEEIRKPANGNSVPFGLEIECEWLKLYGLTDNPEDVVLASNRGQTIGAKGNFTMLNIKGDGLTMENITLGNYCNVDLTYAPEPSLNKYKRASAIVQAQLVFSNGDKVVARNTHFISRLNLAPFWGSKRTLFDHCHFECTDDALNGTAVYLNCNFDFYSSKPFYNAPGTGAVFLDCDINVLTHGTQYLAKAASTIAMVDTRWNGNKVTYIGWSPNTGIEEKYYQYNLSLNEYPLVIGLKDSASTIDLTDTDLLNAYRFKFGKRTIYNTYNLLRGNDDWDPMDIKPIVNEIEESTGKNYSTIPTRLGIKSSNKKIETNKDTLLLEAIFKRFGNYPFTSNRVIWKVAPEFKSIIKILPQKNGTCLVIPQNTYDETKKVIVEALSPEGLEAAIKFDVAPAFIAPPKFKKEPVLNMKEDTLELDYSLDMPYDDESIITWYRCKDSDGKEAIEVAVSRFNTPLKQYKLSSADIGWNIKATIKPKHLRCHAGEEVSIISKNSIKSKNIRQKSKVYQPKIENLSTSYMPQIIPGFWSFDCYKPHDTKAQNWEPDNTKNAWFIGSGINGAANDTGLVQNVKGARLRYEPVGDNFGDMKFSFTAVPAKTAGQGFGSATDQYMDVCIKMDLNSMSGYALRIFRTPKYGDAVDFQLMQYTNGVANPISEAITASSYRPDCIINVETKGDKLIATANNVRNYSTKHTTDKVVKVVKLEAEIDTNSYGGISIQHTGSVGSGATLIKDILIVWK